MKRTSRFSRRFYSAVSHGVESLEPRRLFAGVVSFTSLTTETTEGDSGTKDVNVGLVRVVADPISLAAGGTVYVVVAPVPGKPVPKLNDDVKFTSGLVDVPGLPGARGYKVEFGAFELKKNFTLKIVGDTTFEPTESLALGLAPTPSTPLPFTGTEVGPVVAHVVVIKDNDQPPNVSVSDVTVAEEGSIQSEAVASFKITRTGRLDSATTLTFRLNNQSALAGRDFIGKSGDFRIEAGAKEAWIKIPIINDLECENNETFSLQLLSAENGNIVDGTGIATITDTDLPLLTVSKAAITEGNSGLTQCVFTVTRSGARLNDTCTVDYYTENGSAIEGTDFVGKDGQLIFLPGQTQRTVVVRVAGDTRFESDETFSLVLASPFNANVANAGQATIVNDDRSGMVKVLSNFAGTKTSALQIEGTSKGDAIDVLPAKSGIEVKINAISWGVYPLPDNIVVYGKDGADLIRVAPPVTVRALLFGEGGNDSIYSGEGSDILVGGAGDDQLFSGGGRNLVIGGDGRDRISGGKGDDLLVAGGSDFDSNPAKLLSLMKEWARTDQSYAQRTAHITKGGGLNGSVKLNASTTFSSSELVDSLTGGSGSDLFFAQFSRSADLIADRATGELAVDIG